MCILPKQKTLKMIITTYFQSKKEDNKKVEEIDKKIKELAQIQSKEITLDLGKKVNINKYETMTFLKDIYIEKIKGNPALCNYSIEQVTQVINKYLKQKC